MAAATAALSSSRNQSESDNQVKSTIQQALSTLNKALKKAAAQRYEHFKENPSEDFDSNNPASWLPCGLDNFCFQPNSICCSCGPGRDPSTALSVDILSHVPVDRLDEAAAALPDFADFSSREKLEEFLDKYVNPGSESGSGSGDSSSDNFWAGSSTSSSQSIS